VGSFRAPLAPRSPALCHSHLDDRLTPQSAPHEIRARPVLLELAVEIISGLRDRCQEPQANEHVCGTIEQPRCHLQSTLGPAVARALDRALAGATANYLQSLLAESHERVDDRLASLDEKIADAQSLLEPQLAETLDNLDQLAKNTPRERLTHAHLGHRLPADSLFP